MKMFDNKKGITVLFAIPIIVILGLLFVAVSFGKGGSLTSENVKIKCDVVVDADFFSSLDIEEVTCRNVGSCIFVSKGDQRLGFFSEKGEVRLLGSDGFEYGNEGFKFGSFTGDNQLVVVDACIPDEFAKNVIVQLVNDGNVEKDKRAVSVQ